MRTLVIGASTNPMRYSYKAVERLLSVKKEVLLIGGRQGCIFGLEIRTGTPELEDIHTVTFYIAEEHQVAYVDYILYQVKPRRIIFNPGAENMTFAQQATKNGIDVLNACTLVLVATNQY